MAQQTKVGKVATTVKKNGGRLIVTYHQTEVVIAHDTGQIELNSGGWKTATTKTRMNQASNQFDLGFSVFQKAHEWFVDFRGKTIPFEDHMVLNSSA